MPYVYPTWITDSIKAEKLLQYQKYIIKEFLDNSFQTIQAVFQNQISNFPFLLEAENNPYDVSNFYQNSRLHLMGIIKDKLKSKVKANQNVDNSLFSFLVHIDLDCFFASVALLKYPEFKDKPVAIASSASSYLLLTKSG